MKFGFKQELLKLQSPHNWPKTPPTKGNAPGKKSFLNDTIVMEKSSLKKHRNDSLTIDLGIMQSN